MVQLVAPPPLNHPSLYRDFRSHDTGALGGGFDQTERAGTHSDGREQGRSALTGAGGTRHNMTLCNVYISCAPMEFCILIDV